MRKRSKGRKFHRETGQRKALFKSLATALILHGKIKTTEAKAKDLRSFIEREITYAKKGGLTGIKLARKTFSSAIAEKLLKDIGPKYKDRKGGYTRIIKLGQRSQDAAKIAIIELV